MNDDSAAVVVNCILAQQKIPVSVCLTEQGRACTGCTVFSRRCSKCKQKKPIVDREAWLCGACTGARTDTDAPRAAHPALTESSVDGARAREFLFEAEAGRLAAIGTTSLRPDALPKLGSNGGDSGLQPLLPDETRLRQCYQVLGEHALERPTGVFRVLAPVTVLTTRLSLLVQEAQAVVEALVENNTVQRCQTSGAVILSERPPRLAGEDFAENDEEELPTAGATTTPKAPKGPNNKRGGYRQTRRTASTSPANVPSATLVPPASASTRTVPVSAAKRVLDKHEVLNLLRSHAREIHGTVTVRGAVAVLQTAFRGGPRLAVSYLEQLESDGCIRRQGDAGGWGTIQILEGKAKAAEAVTAVTPVMAATPAEAVPVAPPRNGVNGHEVAAVVPPLASTEPTTMEECRAEIRRNTELFLTAAQRLVVLKEQLAKLRGVADNGTDKKN